ncbi:MAG: hypothetical protein PVG14_00575 [Anaerolineales bacterium]|jgi:hypothetical protein
MRKQLSTLENDRYRRLGFVVVTPYGPDDGGDFGPNTPGTRTAGIQEAIDYATSHFLNLFIAGVQSGTSGRGEFLYWTSDRGWVPIEGAKHRWYYTHEPIRVPPTHGFRIDARQAIIVYEGSGGAVLQIDSCMDAHYRFGILVQNKRRDHEEDGAVVLIKPERPVPLDNFAVATDSTFEFSSLSGGGLFDFDSWQIVRKPYGGGLVLDASRAPILYNRFFVSAILLAEKNVYLTGKKCSNNWIHVMHNQQSTTHLQIGDEHSQPSNNRFDMSINANQLEDSTGARIFGHSNLLTIDIQKASPGRDIVFETTARDNVVTALTHFYPPGSSNPTRNQTSLTELKELSVTNLAKEPTNRITSSRSAGFKIPTPNFPSSGEKLVNRTCHKIEAMIVEPGQVSNWSLIDANGESLVINGGISAGQGISLEPGDQITFTYTSAPEWRWRAVS